MGSKVVIGAFAAMAAMSLGCGADGEPLSELEQRDGLGGEGGSIIGSGGSTPLESCQAVWGGSSNSTSALIFQNGSLLPNGQTYSGQDDTTIEQATPTTNLGAEVTLTSKGGSNRRHVLMRWDLSSVYELTTVQHACMVLNVADPSGSSYPAYEVYGSWYEMQATWNLENSRSAWEVPGAWGVNDAGSTPVAAIPANASGRVYIKLDPVMVQHWVNFNGTNHGIIIGNNSSYNGVSVWSGEAPAASNRPMLVLGL